MQRSAIYLGILTALALNAQEVQRRATFVGGGSQDRGKCTVEVTVDGAAEVQVRGEQAMLRNLSGNPAQWRRFECTGPMPSNPADFRFAGVDGRGRQELVRDPRNGGSAVVRIEDPSGGSENYTFDLFWGGGSGGGPGYSGGPGYPGGQGQGGRRFGRDEALRACQDAVRREADQRFRGRVQFLDGRADDNPGRNDWIVGRLGTPQGEMRYSCSVDFENGRVRSASIEPTGGGGGGGGYPDRGGNTRAVEACRSAAEDRIRREGFGRVEFTSVRMDDQPGRSDWVVGTANAYRGQNFQSYQFSCSVDGRSGNVRNVDLRRR
jgi:hypothetical protein